MSAEALYQMAAYRCSNNWLKRALSAALAESITEQSQNSTVILRVFIDLPFYLQ